MSPVTEDREKKKSYLIHIFLPFLPTRSPWPYVAQVSPELMNPLFQPVKDFRLRWMPSSASLGWKRVKSKLGKRPPQTLLADFLAGGVSPLVTSCEVTGQGSAGHTPALSAETW